MLDALMSNPGPRWRPEQTLVDVEPNHGLRIEAARRQEPLGALETRQRSPRPRPDDPVDGAGPIAEIVESPLSVADEPGLGGHRPRPSRQIRARLGHCQTARRPGQT